jgi:hypothetical protein
MPHNDWQIKISDDGKMFIGVEDRWFLVIPEERSRLCLGKIENVPPRAVASLNADLRFEMQERGLKCESVEHFSTNPSDEEDDHALHMYMDFCELPLLLDVFNYLSSFLLGLCSA